MGTINPTFEAQDAPQGIESLPIGTSFLGNARRKHNHWKVTLYYRDGQKFVRVYTDRERALAFAQRQKKSPVVRSARVREID